MSDVQVARVGEGVQLLCDGEHLFIIKNGVRIARRGPQQKRHKQSTSLEPGYTVFEDGNELTIGYDPPTLAS
jgi:hypothetical protein